MSGSPLHGGRWLTFLPLESLFPRWLPFSLEAFPGRWAVCSVGTIGAGRVGGPGCPVDPQLPHWLVERSASSGRRCRLSRAYGRAAGLSRTLIVPQLTGPRAADPLPSPLQRWDCGGGAGAGRVPHVRVQRAGPFSSLLHATCPRPPVLLVPLPSSFFSTSQKRLSPSPCAPWFIPETTEQRRSLLADVSEALLQLLKSRAVTATALT